MSRPDPYRSSSLLANRPLRAVWLVLLLAAVAATAFAADPARHYSRGVLIRFEGPIDAMLEQYLFRKLDTAKGRGADLVIVEIDSPGGELEASENIAERLAKLDWAHTVAYVPHEALSGAAIVALGCDEIVMDPGARLGDAGVIFLDENFLFHYAPEKYRSNLALKLRQLAEAKGRSPALAEAMVDMDLVVYSVKNRTTGQTAFMSDKEIQASPNPDQWEKGPQVFESREDHFLEVTGTRAVELGLANGTASNRGELEQRYGLDDPLLVLRPTGTDTAVTILNSPIVTGLLFVVGLVALLIEFSTPGIGLGGLTAVLCFSIFFWSRFLGGTAGWLEVILFVVAMIFLGVEIFVLPGFGVAGVIGILLLIVSLVLASQSFIVPRTEHDLETLGQTLLILVCSGVTVATAGIALTWYLGEIPILGRLALKPPEPASSALEAAGPAAPVGQPEPQVHSSGVRVGDSGVADSTLCPAGKARFGDTWVDVLTEGVYVEKGRPVRVLEVRGNRIVVREIDQ